MLDSIRSAPIMKLTKDAPQGMGRASNYTHLDFHSVRNMKFCDATTIRVCLAWILHRILLRLLYEKCQTVAYKTAYEEREEENLFSFCTHGQKP